MTEAPFTAIEITGPPVTPELQAVFGAFGKVRGIVIMTLNIDVTYEDGTVVTFTPVMHPAKQERT
jgi:hypothetical protein